MHGCSCPTLFILHAQCFASLPDTVLQAFCVVYTAITEAGPHHREFAEKLENSREGKQCSDRTKHTMSDDDYFDPLQGRTDEDWVASMAARGLDVNGFPLQPVLPNDDLGDHPSTDSQSDHAQSSNGSDTGHVDTEVETGEGLDGAHADAGGEKDDSDDDMAKLEAKLNDTEAYDKTFGNNNEMDADTTSTVEPLPIGARDMPALQDNSLPRQDESASIPRRMSGLSYFNPVRWSQSAYEMTAEQFTTQGPLPPITATTHLMGSQLEYSEFFHNRRESHGRGEAPARPFERRPSQLSITMTLDDVTDDSRSTNDEAETSMEVDTAPNVGLRNAPQTGTFTDLLQQMDKRPGRY